MHAHAEPGAVGERERGADGIQEVRLDRDVHAAGTQQAMRLDETGVERAVVGDMVQHEPVQDDVERAVGQHVERAGRADDALVGGALRDREARALGIDVRRHETPLRRGQQVATRMPAAADRDRVAAGEPEMAVQQLALAALAALVLLGERRRVADPVEQVLGGAHGASLDQADSLAGVSRWAPENVYATAKPGCARGPRRSPPAARASAATRGCSR